MQPLWNEPALTFRLDTDAGPVTYLAAGEFHIGYENELARRGAFLKSRTMEMAERLLRLARERRATRLVLLGDIKHRVTHLTPQERRDVPRFFEALGPFERVHVVQGNHDAGLRSLLPRHQFPNVEFHPATGLLLEGAKTSVACLHGHAWPKPSLLAAETFLVGHTHAAAALVDEHGQAKTEWAWLRARLDAAKVRAKYGRDSAARLIVFPPFNPLLGGTAINREGLLGPFARLVDWPTAELYLLDGRVLGPVELHSSPRIKR